MMVVQSRKATSGGSYSGKTGTTQDIQD
ncbi:uncharacterized protein METZ01_LOCUS355558 [marine metagenome]|uniref:Uncharacterized protein n=1 Tax=marine metagenome TaxID=408172 RepID=A0A382RYC5_9ZZZZ